MNDMSAWDIAKFEQFLKDKESTISDAVHSPWAKETISLVFQILYKELNFEKESAEYSYKIGKAYLEKEGIL